MGQEKKNSRYDELFPSSEEKAAAFDRIAEHFYNGNFGQMSKGDLGSISILSGFWRRVRRIFLHIATSGCPRN